MIFLYIGYMQISTGLVMILEESSYVDALHYSCMMLTTVGFGDVIRANMLKEDITLRALGLVLFVMVWVLLGMVVVVANVLVVFSVKLERRDVVSVRSIKSVVREGDNIAIVTEVEGEEMKRFTLVKGAGDESRKNLRYLFTT